jgi:hypothetical protein
MLDWEAYDESTARAQAHQQAREAQNVNTPRSHEQPQAPHKHSASCHGAIGELLCGQMLVGGELEPLREGMLVNNPPKPRLHWLQVITYVVVILTCLILVYSIFDAYYAIHQLQEALKAYIGNFSNLTNP